MPRYNPGVQHRQSGFGKTEKTEFTVAGILRDAENFVRATDRRKNKYITMKIKTLMMGLALSFCSAAAFATSAHAAVSEPTPFRQALSAAENSVIVSKPFSNTCTVTIRFGKVSSTMSATCECTLNEACSKAYALALMFVK